MPGKTQAALDSAAPGAKGESVVSLAGGLLAVLLAVVTVWSVPRPTGDLYVGLAAGRDILDGKLNAIDDWSFSTNNDREKRVWVNQNWGTHLLYYFAHDWGGETGLLVLKALLLLVGAAFLALACRRRGVGWPIALLVAGGIMAAGRSFIDLRPNLTTLMFIPVMLYVLYWTQDRPRRIWWVMVIFGVLWANLHGGFFLGLLVMGLWAACMIVPPMLDEHRLQRLGVGVAWSGTVGLAFLAVQGDKLVGAVVFLICLAIHFLVLMFLPGGQAPGRQRPQKDADRPAWHRIAARAAVEGLRGRWPYLAATGGAIALAGIITPFGLQNAFRHDTTLRFTEIWNLTHPLVMAENEVWQQVIEWNSIFTAGTRTFGTTWEFFAVVGLVSALAMVRIVVRLIRQERLTLEDLVLVLGIVVVCAVVVRRAFQTWDEFGLAPLADDAAAAEPRTGWLACWLAYLVIGLGAACVGAAAVRSFAHRRMQPLSAAAAGLLAFDIILAGVGIQMAFSARRFIPLSLMLLAPVAAMQLQWLASRIGWSWPAGLASLALMVPVGFQLRRNALSYWPGNPFVRTPSVLENMITYHQSFPPGAMQFIRDNDLSGRVFNEWRWEGYLHWHCPKLKLFLGGRAQQVYNVETYKLQKYVLSSLEGPAVLERLGVRWIVVPVSQYGAFIQHVVYSRGTRWAPVYFDGENIVAASVGDADGRAAVDRCLKGQFKYPDRAVAALSRGICLSGAAINRPAEAAAALKESQEYRPIAMAYALLARALEAIPFEPAKEIDHLETQVRRLAAMDYRCYGGIDILNTRVQALDLLVRLYEAAKREDQAQRVRTELMDATRIRQQVLDEWQ